MAIRFSAGALLVALGVSSVWSAYLRFNDVSISDLTQDYVSAQAWSDGWDPYDERTHVLVDRYLGSEVLFTYPLRHRNAHTPVHVALLRPLIGFSFHTARAVWLVTMSLLFIASVALVMTELGWSRSAAVLLGAGSLALPPAHSDLVKGQINGLLLVLLVLTWFALRRNDDRLAGSALGVATAIKVFPIFMAIPLLRCRRAGAVKWQLGVASSLTLASMIWMGADASWTFATETAPENVAFWRAAPSNISLTAVPFRWLTSTFWPPDSPDMPVLAWALAAAALCACIAAAARTPAYVSRDLFWAATPWMVLFSPLAWEHYLVLVFPLAIVILHRALRARSVASPLALAGVAITLTGMPAIGALEALAGVSETSELLAWGLPTYGLLALGLSEWRRSASRIDLRAGIEKG